MPTYTISRSSAKCGYITCSKTREYSWNVTMILPLLSYISLNPELELISPLTLRKVKEEGEHIYTYFHFLFFVFVLSKL